MAVMRREGVSAFSSVIAVVVAFSICFVCASGLAQAPGHTLEPAPAPRPAPSPVPGPLGTIYSLKSASPPPPVVAPSPSPTSSPPSLPPSLTPSSPPAKALGPSTSPDSASSSPPPPVDIAPGPTSSTKTGNEDEAPGPMPPPTKSDSGLTTNAVIGIILGCIIALTLIGGCIWVLQKRKRNIHRATYGNTGAGAGSLEVF